MYIRMRVPWSNTFVSVGQVGINFSSFGEPASRLLVQLNVQNMEEDSNSLAAFGATESPSMYIRMCATLE
jgi:hypothetical protein